MTLLRPITPADHAAVLAINARHVAMLSPLDEARLAWLLGLAAHGSVIEVEDPDGLDQQVAGFVLAFAPGTPYDSENYRWFSQRYDDFLYLDRIAIDPAFRRRGLATAAYDELEALAGPRMVLEVNDDNATSLAFHLGRGYADVGRERHVVLMAKDLV